MSYIFAQVTKRRTQLSCQVLLLRAISLFFYAFERLVNSPPNADRGDLGGARKRRRTPPLHQTKLKINAGSTPSCPKEGFGAKLVGDQDVDPSPSQRPQNGLVLPFAAGNPHHARNAFQPCQFQAEHPKAQRVHNLFSASVEEETQTNVANRTFCFQGLELSNRKTIVAGG